MTLKTDTARAEVSVLRVSVWGRLFFHYNKQRRASLSIYPCQYQSLFFILLLKFTRIAPNVLIVLLRFARKRICDDYFAVDWLLFILMISLKFKMPY